MQKSNLDDIKNEKLKDSNQKDIKIHISKELFKTFEPGIKLKYPTMDSQMNEYMERAKEWDPTCKAVSMDDTKRIDLSNNLKKEEVIFTYGLGGCVATSLVFKMKDGSEKVILSHNSPLTIQKGCDDIKNLASDINPKDIEEAKVFILAPGEWEKNNEWKYELSIKKTYKDFINLLEVNGKIIGGSNTEIKEIAYSELLQVDKKNQWTFRIVKMPDWKIKFIVEDYYPQWDVFDNEKK